MSAAALENGPSTGGLAYREFFSDPQLIVLIDEAIANNRELRILNEEVRIARNEVMARRGAYLPFLNIGGSAELEKPSLFTPQGTVEDQLQVVPGKNYPDPRPNFLGFINLNWEIDIWRQLRNARDAAQFRYFAAIARRNAQMTAIVAEVASSYYELLSLDQKMAALDAIIQLQENSMRFAQAAKEAGRGSELAVQRFIAAVQNTRSEKAIIAQEVLQTENRINSLLSRYPQPISRTGQAFMNIAFPILQVGVPSELLLNRQDIMEAERELMAAGLDVQVARAEFLPKVGLRAGVGLEAFDTGYFFQTPESLIYGVAGDLVAPLVNKAAIRAEFQNANARQLQALYTYQQRLVDAFVEVVNSMNRLQNYQQSLQYELDRLHALEASVEVASNLYQNARVEYIEVLLSQRDLVDARLSVIDSKREQLLASVSTYRALGGGWRRSSGRFIAPPDAAQQAEIIPAPPLQLAPADADRAEGN
ncbi:MAG: hypothetical protein KatS3mg111_3265 [Pirellulaceae bacterium]|nr:MAG: hypothetical protein KatS3mg111_3265 [Pirellulaceae bacterium]